MTTISMLLCILFGVCINSVIAQSTDASCTIQSLAWTCEGPGLLPLELLQPNKILGITYLHGDMFCENARIAGYSGLISLAGWNSYRQQAYLRVTETNEYYMSIDMKGWMMLTSTVDLSGGSSRIQLGEETIVKGYLHLLSK